MGCVQGINPNEECKGGDKVHNCLRKHKMEQCVCQMPELISSEEGKMNNIWMVSIRTFRFYKGEQTADLIEQVENQFIGRGLHVNQNGVEKNNSHNNKVTGLTRRRMSPAEKSLHNHRQTTPYRDPPV